MSKYVYSESIKLLLITLLFSLIILPLWSLVSTASDVDFLQIICTNKFNRALWNSIFVSSFSAVLSILIGGSLAWSYTRTTFPLKNFFCILVVLPMLIPSISHGMGLITLFGGSGILSDLLGFQMNIYGFSGIVLGSVMYSFPVAFLMISDILRYEDRTPYEAARTLGIPRLSRFRVITLSYMRAPLLNVFFSVFTMIFTDYGVPLTIGGKYITLPVLMYQDVIGLLDFSKGSVIGSVLLIPAVLSFLFDMSHKDSTNKFTLKVIYPSMSKLLASLSILLFSLVAIFVLLPIFSFGLIGFVKHYPIDMSLTLEHLAKTFHLNAGEYLMNSLLVALVTSVIGTSIATISAYISARVPGITSRLVHILSVISLAIPGIVLGLSYIFFFNGTKVYGTLCILIMANLTHFLASPYLMMYNVMNKLNRSLESVGEVLGINRYHLIKDVFLPLTRSTQIEMFLYFFVNSMMTISAVAFLSTVSTKPLSLMINQFEAQMMMESVGCVSLLILGVNLFMKTLAIILQKNRGCHESY